MNYDDLEITQIGKCLTSLIVKTEPIQPPPMSWSEKPT